MAQRKYNAVGLLDILAVGLLFAALIGTSSKRDNEEGYGWASVAIVVWVAVIIGLIFWKFYHV